MFLNHYYFYLFQYPQQFLGMTIVNDLHLHTKIFVSILKLYTVFLLRSKTIKEIFLPFLLNTVECQNQKALR